jgi:hypothetical protein
MKKKISLEKKLFCNKTTIAVLTNEQRQILAGGVAPVTYLPKCYTRQETCMTIPYTEMACVPCV